MNMNIIKEIFFLSSLIAKLTHYSLFRFDLFFSLWLEFILDIIMISIKIGFIIQLNFKLWLEFIVFNFKCDFYT
jgi:hypothetical protein